MSRETRQTELLFHRRGGWRKGAGRKPKVPGRPGVSHRRRMRFSSARAFHITVRMCSEVANLRGYRMFPVVRRVFCRTAQGRRFRIVHYSVQGNHIHFIIEASDRAALTAGMRRVGIQLALQINRAMGRKKGRVLADRYHQEYLQTPTQVRNAVSYVLCNARRHAWKSSGRVLAAGWLDPYSSSAWFDGWSGRAPPRWPKQGDPVAAPKTWLVRRRWRTLGLISINSVPGR